MKITVKLFFSLVLFFRRICLLYFRDHCTHHIQLQDRCVQPGASNSMSIDHSFVSSSKQRNFVSNRNSFHHYSYFHWKFLSHCPLQAFSSCPIVPFREHRTISIDSSSSSSSSFLVSVWTFVSSNRFDSIRHSGWQEATESNCSYSFDVDGNNQNIS